MTRILPYRADSRLRADVPLGAADRFQLLILGLDEGFMIIGKPRASCSRIRGSALFGLEGLQVTDVEQDPDGALMVWVVTGHPGAAAYPDCGTVSRRVDETVVTRPRDVRRAGDMVDLRWVKIRRKCENRQCPRKTFTEPVPALPPLPRPSACASGPGPSCS